MGGSSCASSCVAPRVCFAGMSRWMSCTGSGFSRPVGARARHTTAIVAASCGRQSTPRCSAPPCSAAARAAARRRSASLPALLRRRRFLLLVLHLLLRSAPRLARVDLGHLGRFLVRGRRRRLRGRPHRAPSPRPHPHPLVAVVVVLIVVGPRARRLRFALRLGRRRVPVRVPVRRRAEPARRELGLERRHARRLRLRRRLGLRLRRLRRHRARQRRLLRRLRRRLRRLELGHARRLRVLRLDRRVGGAHRLGELALPLQLAAHLAEQLHQRVGRRALVGGRKHARLADLLQAAHAVARLLPEHRRRALEAEPVDLVDLGHRLVGRRLAQRLRDRRPAREAHRDEERVLRQHPLEEVDAALRHQLRRRLAPPLLQVAPRLLGGRVLLHTGAPARKSLARTSDSKRASSKISTTPCSWRCFVASVVARLGGIGAIVYRERRALRQHDARRRLTPTAPRAARPGGTNRGANRVDAPATRAWRTS